MSDNDQGLSTQGSSQPNNSTTIQVDQAVLNQLVETQNSLLKEIAELKNTRNIDPLSKINENENTQKLEEEKNSKIKALSKDGVLLETDAKKFLGQGYGNLEKVVKELQGEEESNRVIMKYLITKFDANKYTQESLNIMGYDALKTIYEAEKKAYSVANDPKNGVSVNNLADDGRSFFIEFLQKSPQEKMKTLNMI
jgi:hypothetical protein